MKRKYVTVEDLITNGGDGCTILKEKPKVDHISITLVSNHDGLNKRKFVLIIHEGVEDLVWREIPKVLSKKNVITHSLNEARSILLRNICTGCHYYRWWGWTIGERCERCSDIWSNYRACYCPCKRKRDVSETDFTTIVRDVVKTLK